MQYFIQTKIIEIHSDGYHETRELKAEYWVGRKSDTPINSDELQKEVQQNRLKQICRDIEDGCYDFASLRIGALDILCEVAVYEGADEKNQLFTIEVRDSKILPTIWVCLQKLIPQRYDE